MLMVFAMMGVLLWSSFNKAFTGILFGPSWWPLEVAQFLMVAYCLLGGAYSMKLGDHVRMDLLYGMWSDRNKAWMDVLTVGILRFYLVILLSGSIHSNKYALEDNQVNPTP